VLAGGQPVFAAQPIAVVAGANEWPARPGVVDLRGRVQVLHVAVESASGRPLEDLRQALVPADAATLPDGLQVTDRDQPWIVQVEPPRDLLVAAHGFVPVRVPRPTADLRLSLQPCTTVELRPTTAATVGVAIRVVVDGVDDAVLRAFDSNANQRESGDLLQDGQALELRFAPGTELELVASCQGVTAAPRRVLVGAGGAQVVLVP
jgi:hypothetical protein